MLVVVVRLATHREVRGVVLAAGLVVVAWLDVVDLGGAGTADLAASGGAAPLSEPGETPVVCLTKGAFAPVGAPHGAIAERTSVPLAQPVIVGTEGEVAVTCRGKCLTLDDGRVAVHVRQGNPERAFGKPPFGYDKRVILAAMSTFEVLVLIALGVIVLLMLLPRVRR